jgi:hypothetical protein
MMSAFELIESVAGELNTLPELLLEAIWGDEGAGELVREYGKSNASYDDVLNYLNGII